jgi:hypothetical protein
VSEKRQQIPVFLAYTNIVPVSALVRLKGHFKKFRVVSAENLIIGVTVRDSLTITEMIRPSGEWPSRSCPGDYERSRSSFEQCAENSICRVFRPSAAASAVTTSRRRRLGLSVNGRRLANDETMSR